MDVYTATESAYKNGFEAGFESGYEAGYAIGAEDAIRHGRWINGKCSECCEPAIYSSWDEPVYDYDLDGDLVYSHTETHMDFHFTDYCPYCGAKLDLEDDE